MRTGRCPPSCRRQRATALWTVGQTGTGRAQIANAVLKGTYTASESWFATRRKAAVATMAPSDEESHASWRLRLTHEDADHNSERDSVALRTAARTAAWLTARLRPRPGITDWTEGDSGLGVGAVVLRDDRPRADP